MTDAATVEVVANAPAPQSSPLRLMLTIGGAAIVLGGVIWYARKKGIIGSAGAAALETGNTPLPGLDPWSEIDSLIDLAPDPQTVTAEGDGETASGLPFAWRIYSAPAQGEGNDTPMLQVIVMYESANGTWTDWGDDPNSILFVHTSSVEDGQDKIDDWADEN